MKMNKTIIGMLAILLLLAACTAPQKDKALSDLTDDAPAMTDKTGLESEIENLDVDIPIETTDDLEDLNQNLETIDELELE